MVTEVPWGWGWPGRPLALPGRQAQPRLKETIFPSDVDVRLGKRNQAEGAQRCAAPSLARTTSSAFPLAWDCAPSACRGCVYWSHSGEPSQSLVWLLSRLIFDPVHCAVVQTLMCRQSHRWQVLWWPGTCLAVPAACWLGQQPCACGKPWQWGRFAADKASCSNFPIQGWSRVGPFPSEIWHCHKKKPHTKPQETQTSSGVSLRKSMLKMAKLLHLKVCSLFWKRAVSAPAGCC